MEDDPRTFRVSGPLPPLAESLAALAPLPQNPPASKSKARAFILGLELAFLAVLFALIAVASDSVFFYVLAAFDLVLNVALGGLLLTSRASWWYGLGFLTGTLLSGVPVCLLLKNLFPGI